MRVETAELKISPNVEGREKSTLVSENWDGSTR
jgi:hypothetical protein